MSVRSLNRAATNRAAASSSKIARAMSPYERLRHALESVMAEARAMNRDDVPALVDRISGVARELNERSRP
jgi:hypothetical protein